MAIFIDVTNIDIDIDAIVLSDKILLIIFIVLLVVSNFIFAFSTIVRHGLQAFTQSRYTIRLSLVVGGWLLGLFSFVVIVVGMFENGTDTFNCTTTVLARIYAAEFLQVVYGCGLSLLAIDIIVRAKITQSKTRTIQSDPSIPTKIVSVVFSLLPWIISLVIVCPFTLTEIEWDRYCTSQQTESHMKARLILFGIVPCGITLIIALDCACVYQDKSTESTDSCAFDNPIVDNSHQQNNATTATTALSSPEEKTNQYNFEMEGMNETSPLAIPTQERKSNSNNAPFTTRFSTNNTVPMYAHRTNDTLYDKKTLRKEAMIVVICSMLFAMTSVPYYILCVYVMDTYQYRNNFIYEGVDKQIFIALDALAWITPLFPVLVPLISMAV